MALKKLEGNPGKRKLNTKEPVPEQGMPDCPKWLLPEAKKEWKRLCQKLSEMGALTATKRLVNHGNAGYYQVLSAEVGGKHGFSMSGFSIR